MNLISICEFNFLVWDKWKFQSKRENRINSNIWDELKFEVGEIPKIIYHVQDEIKN